MGNEYGMSPFQIMQLIGPMMVIVPFLIWLVAIGPMLMYPLARWKAHREAYVDTQLGLKVALHYFRMMGFQLLLLGTLVLVWTVISKGSDKGDMYRAAFGFIVPAGILFGVHHVLIGKTNDAQYPNVRRLFLGYNLIITGLLGAVALVLSFQALFAKGSTGNEGRLFFAGLVVYCGAWAACGVQFGRTVFGDYGSGASPPGNVVAAPPPPAPGAQASGGGGPQLPSLGGGSYPPIDQK